MVNYNEAINDFQAKLKSDVLKTIAKEICDDDLLLLCILEDIRLANAVMELAKKIEPLFVNVNVSAFVLSIDPEMTWEKCDEIWAKAKFKIVERKSFQSYATRFWRKYKQEILSNKQVLDIVKKIKEDCEMLDSKAAINAETVNSDLILNAFRLFVINVAIKASHKSLK